MAKLLKTNVLNDAAPGVDLTCHILKTNVVRHKKRFDFLRELET
jgi:hypothetical protein